MRGDPSTSRRNPTPVSLTGVTVLVSEKVVVTTVSGRSVTGTDGSVSLEAEVDSELSVLATVASNYLLPFGESFTVRGFTTVLRGWCPESGCARWQSVGTSGDRPLTPPTRGHLRSTRGVHGGTPKSVGQGWVTYSARSTTSVSRAIHVPPARETLWVCLPGLEGLFRVNPLPRWTPKYIPGLLPSRSKTTQDFKHIRLSGSISFYCVLVFTLYCESFPGTTKSQTLQVETRVGRFREPGSCLFGHVCVVGEAETMEESFGGGPVPETWCETPRYPTELPRVYPSRVDWEGDRSVPSQRRSTKDLYWGKIFPPTRPPITVQTKHDDPPERINYLGDADPLGHDPTYLLTYHLLTIHPYPGFIRED